MADRTTAPRTRLPPQQRRAAILDAAVRLVLREGATRINMPRVAAEAGVSKALVYVYFRNISELLLQLYVRENRKLHRQHLTALADPHSFETMVTTTARISRSAGADRRRLTERLAGHPSIQAAVSAEDQQNRAQVIEFLSGEITRSFSIPELVARQATALALRYDEQAQQLSADAGRLDEIWGAMMVGAMKELERRFGGDEANGTDVPP